ncbi:MAG TPA: Lrp/AsnC family transcriptional regulator, partial [Candidatus Ozemobacteraceae bacterium]|nr:Lrp/AsnC family transcriptional regulator [Candidatus Ozemobacteraceae bacterium]
MNDQDIRLIRELQNGIKLERRPFLRLAKELNLSEDQVLERVRALLKEGLIRRVGISVRPHQVG